MFIQEFRDKAKAMVHELVERRAEINLLDTAIQEANKIIEKTQNSQYIELSEVFQLSSMWILIDACLIFRKMESYFVHLNMMVLHRKVIGLVCLFMIVSGATHITNTLAGFRKELWSSNFLHVDITMQDSF